MSACESSILDQAISAVGITASDWQLASPLHTMVIDTVGSKSAGVERQKEQACTQRLW
jgi:hypothetical protein